MPKNVHAVPCWLAKSQDIVESSGMLSKIIQQQINKEVPLFPCNWFNYDALCSIASLTSSDILVAKLIKMSLVFFFSKGHIP